LDKEYYHLKLELIKIKQKIWFVVNNH
jgi:hypothetical protein